MKEYAFLIISLFFLAFLIGVPLSISGAESSWLYEYRLEELEGKGGTEVRYWTPSYYLVGSERLSVVPQKLFAGSASLGGISFGLHEEKVLIPGVIASFSSSNWLTSTEKELTDKELRASNSAVKVNSWALRLSPDALSVKNVSSFQRFKKDGVAQVSIVFDSKLPDDVQGGIIVTIDSGLFTGYQDTSFVVKKDFVNGRNELHFEVPTKNLGKHDVKVVPFVSMINMDGSPGEKTSFCWTTSKLGTQSCASLKNIRAPTTAGFTYFVQTEEPILRTGLVEVEVVHSTGFWQKMEAWFEWLKKQLGL